MQCLDDTIAAIASPPGGAARGIIRLSGPGAYDSIAACFHSHADSLPFPIRQPIAVPGAMVLPGIASPLPAEAFFWPTGRSYTGQAVVEIHSLGSPPLLDLALRTLCRSGARLAEPGEFTLRAFLSGRIDLTQAEAVLGVIDANSPHELNTALTQLAGGLTAPLQQLRNLLLDLLSHLEAGLDFADEDIPFISRDVLEQQINQAIAHVQTILQQMASRSETAEHLRVVFIGRPNVGKSSLFNALLGKTNALVSAHPGTTRDYLQAEILLDGISCQLIDTAGVDDAAQPQTTEAAPLSRDTNSSLQTSGIQAAGNTIPIDRAAQAMASEQRRQAHIEVLCLDATRPLDAWERHELSRAVERRLVVLTKCDLPHQGMAEIYPLETSSRTGLGLDALQTELRQKLAGSCGEADMVAATAVRCFDSLRLADECLRRAAELAPSSGEELIATELRVALNELGKVVGAVYTDDVLDRIFSRFCIGK